jgi:hypothetical protein
MTDETVAEATPEPDAIDRDAAEQELAAGGSKRRRKKLLQYAKEAAPSDTRTYALGPLLGVPLFTTLDSDEITREGGPPAVVADLLHGVAQLITSIDPHVILTVISFGNSVTFQMQPVVPDDVRQRVEELVENEPNAPLTPTRVEALIPDSVAAANVTARILEMPPEVGYVEARRWGAEVGEAYLSLAKSLVKHEASIKVEAPGDRRARMTQADAEEAVEAADKFEELEPIDVRIVGRLTRADSEEAHLRVLLDRERLPREFDARRRAVEGEYTSLVSNKVQQLGLWDSNVIATVRAFRERQPGKDKEVFASFRFTDIDPWAGN